MPKADWIKNDTIDRRFGYLMVIPTSEAGSGVLVNRRVPRQLAAPVSGPSLRVPLRQVGSEIAR